MSMTYSYVKRVLQLPIWKLAGKEYGKTANNYFSHVNKGIFDKNGEVRDHDELVLSEGSLLNPSGMTIEHTGESTYKISWIPENENTTGAADDQLMVLVYTENVPRYFSIRWADNTTGTRAEGTGTFTIPRPWARKTCTCTVSSARPTATLTREVNISGFKAGGTSRITLRNGHEQN